MTTGLQVALLGGAFLGLGVVLLIARLTPAEPDLAEALTRLTPARGRANTVGSVSTAKGKERVGVWAIKTLPPALWIRTPTRELAILRIPLSRFYGEKIVMALMGLASRRCWRSSSSRSASGSPSPSRPSPASAWRA